MLHHRSKLEQNTKTNANDLQLIMTCRCSISCCVSYVIDQTIPKVWIQLKHRGIYHRHRQHNISTMIRLCRQYSTFDVDVVAAVDVAVTVTWFIYVCFFLSMFNGRLAVTWWLCGGRGKRSVIVDVSCSLIIPAYSLLFFCF